MEKVKEEQKYDERHGENEKSINAIKQRKRWRMRDGQRKHLTDYRTV